MPLTLRQEISISQGKQNPQDFLLAAINFIFFKMNEWMNEWKSAMNLFLTF